MSKDVIHVVAAVIEDEGRYLIVQRMPHAVLPLLWEFPGGRVEDEETADKALQREVAWRIGIDVEIIEHVGNHIHQYEHYDVHMGMYACRLPEGAHPKVVNVNDLVWVTSAQMSDYQFPPADEGTMDKLLGLRRD